MRIPLLLLLLLLFLPAIRASACTIVSGTDRKGQTWAMNNEDFLHTSSTCVNVFPAKEKNTLGYITFTYGSPESSVQGGANAAGLFFDINALPPPQQYKLSTGKKPFPHGNMLEYMLQHCQSVPEFLALWETYYLPDLGDQIHVADKYGNLAVIAPDTIVRATQQLTSTNFNVCDTGPQKQRCWRYPIAQQVLSTGGISHANLVKLADATSWREFTTTVYTNIHNLSTGDIWFYLAEDFQTPWRTNIQTLLKGGKRSILLTSQFPQNAGVRLTQVLTNHGTAKAVSAFLQAGRFSEAQKESMLRLTFLHQFYIEKAFAKASLLFPLWERYLPTNKKVDGTEVQFTKAEVLATQGKKAEAIRVLEAVQTPNWKTDALLANLRNTAQPNVVLHLNGFLNAKAVVAEVKGHYNFYYFLHKTPAGWALRLKSDQTELKYCFYVDGKRTVDPAQPVVEKQETVKGDFAAFNVWRLK
ncbi:hypothetical protein [Hymenobacter arizonensis]|uniref:Uncharacterized protein n=1 Tax=Hymenobacter arizonensis TaxID=1227077 RepID=A0A1I6BHL2_HYMAR|nr:hypothetical protein [Hymenobacter arizonensis]SFQ80394.1 hypothetical protein SAMN04515668_4575 [Hymenobacter arizonensis]